MSEEKQEVTVVEAKLVEEKQKIGGNALSAMVLSSPQQMAASVAIESHRTACEVVTARLAAMALPRNREAVLEKLLEYCKDPVFAELAIYEKPAGKVKNESTGKWEQQYIEGPSARLLERIASDYCNFQVTTRVMPPVNGCTEILVRTTDLETNAILDRTYAVPHERWKKAETEWDDKKKAYVVLEEGKVIPVVEPDKIRMLVLSEESKQIRNTISKAVDATIVKTCYEACQTTNRVSDIEALKDVPKLLNVWCGKLNVSKAQLFNFLKIKNEKELEPTHVRRLRCLYVAAQEGEVSISELFDGAKDVPLKKKEDQKPQPEPVKEVKEAAPPKPAAKVEEKLAPKPEPKPEPKEEPKQEQIKPAPPPQEEPPAQDEEDGDEGEEEEDEDDELPVLKDKGDKPKSRF